MLNEPGVFEARELGPQANGPREVSALRDEAAQEPDPVHTGEATSETQVIAIYGKGGSGKGRDGGKGKGSGKGKGGYKSYNDSY